MRQVRASQDKVPRRELANEITDILVGAAAPRLATGQPDATEDGAVDANDITGTALVIIGDLINDTVCGDAT